MTRQGFFGALEQYWTLEPQARLHRRNTYFNDVMSDVSNESVLKVGIVVSLLGTGLIVFWSLAGVML